MRDFPQSHPYDPFAMSFRATAGDGASCVSVALCDRYPVACPRRRPAALGRLLSVNSAGQRTCRALASSAGDRGLARCQRWATSWRRWAAPPPAVVSFAGDAGQWLWRRCAGGWRFATTSWSHRRMREHGSTRSLMRPRLSLTGEVEHLRQHNLRAGASTSIGAQDPLDSPVRAVCAPTGYSGHEKPPIRSMGSQ